MNSQLPPYPRFGECIRAFTNALDITPESGADIGRFAREGDFDWEKLDRIFDDLLKPIEKICGKLTIPLLKAWLSDIRDSYTYLILGLSLDALSRDQSLPILVSRFLPPHLAKLLYDLNQKFPGPDLAQLLDSGKRPVNTVLEWLDAQLCLPVEELLFPESTGQDRASKEKLRKWRKGVDIPASQGIALLNNELQRKPGTKALSDDETALWLLVAAALARMEQGQDASIRPLIYQCLQAQQFLHDAPVALAEQVHAVGDSWPELREMGSKVWYELWRTIPKQIGDQAHTWAEIIRLQALAQQQDPEGRLNFHYPWMKARWHVLSGQYEEAYEPYKQAFELACYRAGHQVKSIIEEAACIAAFLGKKPFLKQLKHVGIALELFAKADKKTVLEDWEIEWFSDQLPQLFPNEGRFPEAEAHLPESAIQGFQAIPQATLDALKPDLKRPDRIRAFEATDGSVTRWPQLRLFTALGDADAVQALLQAGADINQLDGRGASALLVALKRALEHGDRQVLDMLLQHPHAHETLNTPTPRERLTPLYRAIQLGQPDVVQALLAQGANPDTRILPDRQTVLYHTISLLWRLHQPDQMQERLFGHLMQDPDRVQREALRRQGVVSAGTFGDSHTHFQQAPMLAAAAVEWIAQGELRMHSKPRLTSIVRLLLASGADPNARHDYPAPGRTPLMLAAESDLVEIFALMVEQHGGKPLLPDAAGQTSHDIARSFRAYQVHTWLQRSGR